MLLAKNENQESIWAKPKLIAFCPGCGVKVIPKCGEIVTHHWAHKTKSNCIYEPETEWHLKWKISALEHGLEIEVHFGDHVADAIDQDTKKVIEFQHSSIDVNDVNRRCEFYKSLGYKIDWIFDYSKKKKNFNIDSNGKILYNKGRSVKSIHPLFDNKFVGNKKNYGHPVYGDVYFDFDDGDEIYKVHNYFHKIEPRVVSGEFIKKDSII